MTLVHKNTNQSIRKTPKMERVLSVDFDTVGNIDTACG